MLRKILQVRVPSVVAGLHLWIVSFLIVASVVGSADGATPAPWAFAGGDLQDSRVGHSVDGGQPLTADNVSKLKLKWTFDTAGVIRGTPTVEQGGLYVTDKLGMLYKLDPVLGTVIWSHPISYYTGNPNAGRGLRAGPAIGSQGEIVFGDTASPTIMAVNRTTGALIWKTVVDSHPNAIVPAGAVIYKGIVYVGIGSNEEFITKTQPNYIPTFRGSVVALDEATGAIVWKFFTAPPGYAGAAIWNSQPVIYPAGNSIIVATGNNYWVPEEVQTCVLNSGSTRALQDSLGVKCLDPADQVDSIIALDLTTGQFIWSRKFGGPDTFSGGCEVGASTCPNPEGKDDDFSAAPNLVQIPNFIGVKDDQGGVSNGYLLGAGEKSGIYWGINPNNGGLFWSTFIGNGGIQWGSAALSAGAAFVAIDNRNDHLNNLLVGATGRQQYWNSGLWGSLSLGTGKLRWEVPAYGQDLTNPTFGGGAPGPLSYTNRVAFAGSSSGYMVGLNSLTGGVLWSYNTGVPLETAPAIFNDTLYWGAPGTSGTSGRLYAFSLPQSSGQVAAAPVK